MSNTRTKLNLGRETLRKLTADTLVRLHGGTVKPDGGVGEYDPVEGTFSENPPCTLGMTCLSELTRGCMRPNTG